MDLNKYVEGIDTDGVSYKYFNSLTAFKITYAKEIKIQNDLVTRYKQLTLQEMLKMI